MAAHELRFLNTAAPELLLAVLGLQNPNSSDKVGFSDYHFRRIFGPQGFFELPFVCVVCTSRVALRFFHAVFFFGGCRSFFLPSSCYPFKTRQKRKRKSNKDKNQ